MTLEQLRSIFHVESQDLVPHYEVIHLTHHGTTEHKVSKRSIATASSSAVKSHQNNQFDDVTIHKSYSHHVKKDLSKSAYYSELKKTFTSLPVSTESSALRSTNSMNSDLNHTNSSNKNSFSSNNNQTKLVENSLRNSEFDIPSGNEYKSQFTLPSKLAPSRESDDSDSDEQTKLNPIAQLDLANIKEHNVSLSVFGQVLNLTLKQTNQLFKNGPQSLQMFSVNVSPNATHGLSYEPIEEVSSTIILFCCFFFFLLPSSSCRCVFLFSFYYYYRAQTIKLARILHSLQALQSFFVVFVVVSFLSLFEFVSEV